jgi:pyridoxamine 5'-phosphate oxidase family protein
LSAQKVARVHEFAQTQGEASTADAAAEAIPEVLQADDPLIKVVAPRRGEPLPIPAGWGAAVRQAIESVLDASEGDAHGLRGADERHSPEYLPREPPLVPRGARAVDKAFGLVEVEGRDGDAAAGRYLAHSQLGRRTRGSGHSLDLNLTLGSNLPDMTFSDAEVRFLVRQPRGHLATLGPNGTPQVKPLGFAYNPTLGTIDIAGFNMSGSAKYHNVQANSNVAFVVDEVTAPSMDGAHFLEIRGVAETAVGTHDPQGHLAPEIIRIHPRRIVSFNVDPEHPGFVARDVVSADPENGVA